MNRFVVNDRPSDLRCSVCHGGDELGACRACGTKYHADCRSELGRCPTLGCRDARPGVRHWARLGPALGLSLITAAVSFVIFCAAFAATVSAERANKGGRVPVVDGKILLGEAPPESVVFALLCLFVASFAFHWLAAPTIWASRERPDSPAGTGARVLVIQLALFFLFALFTALGGPLMIPVWVLGPGFVACDVAIRSRRRKA